MAATPTAIPSGADRPSGVPLYALGAGNFVVGVGAFVVIGILGPVLRDLGLTNPEAGMLMTAYAIGYAVASPFVVALTGKFDRRDVVVAGLALFTLGTALSALAPSFAVLLAARLVTALGAALYTPVAAAAAIGLVPADGRARALGIVFGGLTLAQVVGVPLGSYVGYTLGWRSAFWIVLALGLAALPVIVRAVPRRIAVPRADLALLFQVLRSGRLMLAVAFTAIFIGAAYVVYTFVGPMMEARFDLGANGVTLFLLVFGLGAVVGNAMGASLTQRLGSDRTLVLLSAAQMILLPALTVAALGLSGALALTLLWSLGTWSFMVPQQARLVALAPKFQGLLLALNASAIYVGASIGSTLGGVVLQHASFAALGPIAAVVVAVALLSLWAVRPTAAPKP